MNTRMIQSGGASLRRAIPLVVFAVMFAAILGGSSLQLWQRHDELMLRQHQAWRALEGQYRNTLARAVWDVDQRAIQEHLDRMAQAEGVVYAQIDISVGFQLQAVHVGLSRDQADQLIELPLTVQEEHFPAHEAARLRLGVSEGLVREQFVREQLVPHVAFSLLLALLASLFLSAALHWRVLRPLKGLLQFTEQYDIRQPAAREEVLQHAALQDQPAEFHLLVRRLADLSESLREHQIRESHAQRILQDTVEERTRALRLAQADLEQRNAALQVLSLTDPLTGLGNRRALDEALLKTVSYLHREGGHLAVLMCDLDHFKRINDRLGHEGGDRILQRFATVVREVCRRPHDLAARFGGEEFVVLMPGPDAADARQMAERLRLAFRQRSWMDPGGEALDPMLRPTVSIGVATGHLQGAFGESPRHAFSPERLTQHWLDVADQALYEAKRTGRDRCVVHEVPPLSGPQA